MAELLGNRSSRQGHAVVAETRRVESPAVTELYINIRPIKPATESDAATALYSTAADLLREHQARIFSERIFATPAAISVLEAARSERLGDFDDGAPATVLNVPANDGVSIAGLQIHAIHAENPPETVRFEDETLGRRFEYAGRSWVHLAGLTPPLAEAPAVQTRAVYTRAADVLRSLDMDFRSVARTWIWLRDILGWYDDFNAARTAVYEEEHLVDTGGRARYLPASTGIGVAPADGSACALELLAVSDGDRSIRSIQSGGEQDSAFSYGSAFARAVVAPMPAGPTLFVSGTAAIDRRGRSEHPGDAARQIDATLQHIRALLGEAGWSEDRIVSATAYSKTPEIARAFAKDCSALPWPRIETIADICRDELLFEVEVTAAGHVPGH